MTDTLKVPVQTKLSDPEFNALLLATDASEQVTTRSAYVRLAIIEKLTRERFLRSHEVAGAPECPHEHKATFGWGSKCLDCDVVLTGNHVRG